MKTYTKEQLQKFSDIINTNWVPYSAKVTESLVSGYNLCVYDSKERVLTLKANGRILKCAPGIRKAVKKLISFNA